VRRLIVSGAMVIFLACSDRGPTAPGPTGSGSVRPSGAATESARPQRPATRVVAPRSSVANPVALGVWGGEHVSLVVADTGGTLDYDCAHGTIDPPLVTDPDGRFDLVGTHTREHGGPIRSDEKPDKHPARYTGAIDGETMALTVTLTDSAAPPATFTLTRGRIGQVFKCL
jgi:hypothetical protein